MPSENPNEALTAYYLGDKIIFVPVIDYYLYTNHPEIALAQLAIKESLEEEDENV